MSGHDLSDLEPTPYSGATIHERMLAILADLPAIGKGQWNAQQQFHFRGHDDVLNALNPLLAQHGVFVVPEVLERVAAHRSTRGGTTMYEVSLHVRYTFFGASGDTVTASAWGEGTDMGDKATSKAMTMAFKQVLQQSFAISTAETSDPDGQTPEQTTAGAPGSQAPRGWAALIERWEWLFGGPDDEFAQETTRQWMLEAVRAKHPTATSIAMLGEADKREAGAMLTAALLALEDDSVGSLEFGTGVREKIVNVFVGLLDGVVLEGPPWALGPDDDLPAFASFRDNPSEGAPEAATAPETPAETERDGQDAGTDGVDSGAPTAAPVDGDYDVSATVDDGVDEIPFGE